MPARRRAGWPGTALLAVLFVVVVAWAGGLVAIRLQAGAEREPLDMPDPVGLRLVTLAFAPERLTLVDLGRGERATYPPGSFGLSRNPVDGVVLTGAGLLVVWQDGVVTAFHEGDDAPLLVHEPEIVAPAWSAPALTVLPTLDERALWVVQPGYEPEGIGGRAELVGLDGERAFVSASLPAGLQPVGVSSRGLVLNAFEPATVLELSPGGVLTELARGRALAGAEDSLGVLVCEQAHPRSCRLDLVDLATGDTYQVPEPEGGSWVDVTCPSIPTTAPCWPATSGDGRLLVGAAMPGEGGGQVRLAVVDRDGARFLPFVGAGQVQAAWERGGGRVVVVTAAAEQSASDLTVLDLGVGSILVVPQVIPAGHYVLATR